MGNGKWRNDEQIKKKKTATAIKSGQLLLQQFIEDDEAERGWLPQRRDALCACVCWLVGWLSNAAHPHTWELRVCRVCRDLPRREEEEAPQSGWLVT